MKADQVIAVNSQKKGKNGQSFGRKKYRDRARKRQKERTTKKMIVVNLCGRNGSWIYSKLYIEMAVIYISRAAKGTK